jgi:hypothetical protein
MRRSFIAATLAGMLLACGGGGQASPTPRPHPSPTPVTSQTQPFSMPQHLKGGKYDVHWQLFANDTGKGLIVYLTNPSTGQRQELVSSGSDIGDQVVAIPDGDYEVTVATLVRQFIVTLTPVSS